jgi:hypothetical protein
MAHEANVSLEGVFYGDLVLRLRVACSKASVVNNNEDNSWAFVVITCLFA